MIGMNKVAPGEVTPGFVDRSQWKRVWRALLLAFFSILLIAGVPWVFTYGSMAWEPFKEPLGEYALRIPLLILLAIIAQKLIPKRFTTGLPRPAQTIQPKGRKALIFVHGMGVQDKDEMVTDLSDGIAAYGDGAKIGGVEYTVEPDWSQRIIHDEIALFVKNSAGSELQLDCYEAYWGPLFNGYCKWQSTIPFAVGAIVKATLGLGDVVRKKRIKELTQAGLALVALGGLLLLIASGTKVAMEYIDSPTVNPQPGKVALMRPSFADRVIETGAFIAKSVGRMKATSDDFLKTGGIVKMDDLKKIPEKYSTGAILVSLIYSAAWAYMLYSLGAAIVHILGMKLDFRDVPGSRGEIYRRKWKTLLGLVESGLLATFVYIVLDPMFSMPLVRLAVCLSLLYLFVWVIKYWLTNFLGDVQIFVNSNANSTYFKAREAAVDFVANRIDQIVAKVDSAGKPLYDEIYVIGHSLGSAVGASALRRLADRHSTDPNRPRLPGQIKAYITIGSPLRKIRKFYKAQAYKRSTVEFAYETDVEIFRNDSKDATRTPWYNFWYWNDIFADQLCIMDPIKDRSYFTILQTDDIQLAKPHKLWSHSYYWNDPEWVGRVLELMS